MNTPIRVPAILRLPCITCAMVIALQAPAATPPFVFFRAGFDGSTDGFSHGGGVPATQQKNVAYVPGAALQALQLGAGCTLEHELGHGFPSKAGALEVWFKPGFPQKPDQPARTVFSLLGRNDAKLKFGYDPEGTRWQFGIDFPGWQRSVAASFFEHEKP